MGDGAESAEEMDAIEKAEAAAQATLDADEREVLRSLDAEIAHFKLTQWPTYRRHGFTLDGAFHAYQLNYVAHSLDRLTGDDEHDEPWRRT